MRALILFAAIANALLFAAWWRDWYPWADNPREPQRIERQHQAERLRLITPEPAQASPSSVAPAPASSVPPASAPSAAQSTSDQTAIPQSTTTAQDPPHRRPLRPHRPPRSLAALALLRPQRSARVCADGRSNTQRDRPYARVDRRPCTDAHGRSTSKRLNWG